jgi:hypothetical protein
MARRVYRSVAVGYETNRCRLIRFLTNIAEGTLYRYLLRLSLVSRSVMFFTSQAGVHRGTAPTIFFR